MMRSNTSYCWLTVLFGAALIAGCASTTGSVTTDTGTTAEVNQIPRISELYAKATARPAVHRFRKPLRDEQNRILRLLAAECERMVADLQTQDIGDAALTAATSDQQEATGITALETSLTKLGTAARQGNTRAMRTAHAAALDAYTKHQHGNTPPGS